MRHATTRGAPIPWKNMKGIVSFNDPLVARGETPSAAANCSARGLAKVANMMSSGGRDGQNTYIEAAGWKAMHADPIEVQMGMGTTNFTQGGVNLFTEADARSSLSDLAPG